MMIEDKALLSLMESLMDDDLGKEMIREVMEESDPYKIVNNLIEKFYKEGNNDKV